MVSIPILSEATGSNRLLMDFYTGILSRLQEAADDGAGSHDQGQSGGDEAAEHDHQHDHRDRTDFFPSEGKRSQQFLNF